MSNRNSAADAVVRADSGVFEEIAAGTKNPYAAFLRGAVTVEGDMDLVVQFFRLLPAPPRAKPGGQAARGSKR